LGRPLERRPLIQLKSAQLQLSYCRVTAPVNGYVTNLTLSPGSYANVGSSLGWRHGTL
jgi:multidrug resistance efflux pump